jgi:hypothetical protein
MGDAETRRRGESQGVVDQRACVAPRKRGNGSGTPKLNTLSALSFMRPIKDLWLRVSPQYRVSVPSLTSSP